MEVQSVQNCFVHLQNVCYSLLWRCLLLAMGVSEVPPYSVITAVA